MWVPVPTRPSIQVLAIAVLFMLAGCAGTSSRSTTPTSTLTPAPIETATPTAAPTAAVMTPSPPVLEMAVITETTLAVELLDAETNQTAYNRTHTIRTELRIQDPLRPKSYYLTLSTNGTTIWQSVLHECEYERVFVTSELNVTRTDTAQC